jgi:uncharacterized membrane protein YkvA (DUF1232 family)
LERSKETPRRKPLLHRAGDGFRTFLKMMRDPQYRFPTKFKIALIVLVLYVISPIDVIPDFLPILGFADDGAFLAGLFWMAMGLVSDYDKTRKG